MNSQELRETIAELNEQLQSLDGKYKLLRRRHHLHRGAITGDQADQLRRILRGHQIDASQAVNFHPEEFFDLEGNLDGGAVLWWLDSARGRWKR
jgi:hypothetical protein